MNHEMMGWQWHQTDHILHICPSLHTDNHTSTSSPNFNWPDALYDMHPIVSKHQKQNLVDKIHPINALFHIANA